MVTRKGDKSISSKKPNDSAQVQHNNNATLPTGAYNIKQTTCLVSYNVESRWERRQQDICKNPYKLTSMAMDVKANVFSKIL